MERCLFWRLNEKLKEWHRNRPNLKREFAQSKTGGTPPPFPGNGKGPRFSLETGPCAFVFYRNRCMPSVAAAGSPLMVTVNLMLFRSPKLSSQFRKVSVSPSTSLPTILQKLSMNIWEMS